MRDIGCDRARCSVSYRALHWIDKRSTERRTDIVQKFSQQSRRIVAEGRALYRFVIAFQPANGICSNVCDSTVRWSGIRPLFGSIG
jgi:hypothetical protein